LIVHRPKHGFVARLLVPSIASAFVHLTLLGVVLAATVTIVSRPDERPQLTDIAIAAPAPTPAHAETTPDPAPPAPRPTRPATGEASQSVPVLTSRASELAHAQPASLPQPRSAVASVAIEPVEPARAVSFAGVTAQAARRVVYVVDASGSMVNSYAFVRARLAQSIAQLSPTQYFQVILVRGKASGAADVQVLPHSGQPGTFVRALPSNKESAIAWLEDVVVGGRSDPIEGLERALTLEPRPDLVFFLARGFQRSGPDSTWGRGVEATLRLLDRLNPRNRRTGLRPVVIKTIQFLNDDPTGLMQSIAEAHGDGPGSFRVLTIDDLAEEGVQADAIPREHEQDASVRRARAILRAIGPDDLHVLYGIASPEQTERVREAVAQVRRLIEGVDETLTQGVRARMLLLESALQGTSEPARAAAEMLEALFVMDADADASRRLMLAHALARAGQIEQARAQADALAADVELLGLAEALAAELSVLRVRFGLGEPVTLDTAWAQLAGEAEAVRLLSTPNRRAEAFDRLLDWAGDDQARQAVAWRAVALATEQIDDLDSFPLEVRLARAMFVSLDRPDEAIVELLAMAETQRDLPLVREALWEAALLARTRDPIQASGLLQRFATEYADDQRAVDAMIAALDLEPNADPAQRVAILRHLLDVAPSHPAADCWRVELAEYVETDEALRVLSQTSPDSAQAPAAADLVCMKLASDSTAAHLRTGVAILESLADARAVPLRERLVRALLETEPQEALQAMGALDADEPRIAMLRAEVLLACGMRQAALKTLNAQVNALAPEQPEYWQAWALLLELLADDSAQVEALRAHVFRLRLLDPQLGGEPWRGRIERVAGVLVDP